MPAPGALYPATLDLTRSAVLVVGAGAVALRKLKGLPQGLGSVRIVAPQAAPALRTWLKRRPKAVWLKRGFRRGDLAGCRIVFCCTGDPALNASIAAKGRIKGLWVCQASDPSQGDIQVPAVVRAAGVQMTLSTGGASPALARALRSHFGKILKASDLRWLLKQLQGLRPKLKLDARAKARLLEKLTTPAALDALLAPRSGAGRGRLEALLKP